MNQLIKNQSLDGFKRITKSIKNLESNQSFPIQTGNATVSSPPTLAQINSVFDTPANVGQDFVGLIIDSVNGNQWLVWTDSNDWYYAPQSLTIAV